ncbi:enoyl-CoA hydratase [Aquamicrobium sp. LC103]|uniref:enoyl-CoA hydratase n=1 Tax=Aquamicrobium sp. LC103 TaxID=1120658 RepID=UPI00063E9E50|nr:enoyl-CoA hydratase [Aquamicrobium sp. LC103]TKT69081.1 enoyl-CoA hydratase [Aquamicrobium sp. LC103]
MADILALKKSEPAGPVAVAVQDGILRLTLAKPPANALSLATLAALQAEFEAAEADASIRVIVLAAEGKVFCAGHDLKELTAHRGDVDRGRAFYERTMTECSRLMQTIVRHPKPVIAEIDGTASAAGCQLVASCDLAIATDQASFATPGVNIGLFCSTPMVALSRNVSRKHAMEMLLTGEAIDAQAARDFGLVNRVVPREYLNQIVMKYAQTIASKSPLTLKIGKEAFYAQAEMGLSDAYEYASRVMVENMMARDAAEGIGAFIEKRNPEWKGE